MPPLRSRLEDIPRLVAYFADTLATGSGVQRKQFAEEAVRRLQERAWPGNVRELRNAVERALILSPGKVVTAADIDTLLPRADAGEPPSFDTFRQDSERNFLLFRLRQNDWNVAETARALKMPRSNLYKKIERYGLSRETP